MYSIRSAIALLAFIPAILASPSPNHRQCTDFKVPVHVKANNSIYDVPRVDNSYDAANLVNYLTRWTARLPPKLITGDRPVDETFTINGRLCLPSQGTKSNILMVATHGGVFDMRYWDARFQPEKYSYVDAALAAGYSIFIYDRLGVGGSSKPDGYEVVQNPADVEVLHQLTLMARSGDLMKAALASRSLPSPPKFEKIVLVGHSIGTAITSGALTAYGELIDGAILTGLIANNHSGGVTDAFGWEKSKGWPSGYVKPATKFNLAQIFFNEGFYDRKALDYAFEVSAPSTVGQMVSSFKVFPYPAPKFMGPILFALAELDTAVCGGNCTNVWSEEGLKKQYPVVSDLKVDVQKGSGHGLTLHTTAPEHYQKIMSFLAGNGL